MGLFCIRSVRKREEFYCGCTEELSQEVALWLAGPGVERKASQMQHIVSLAALYSTAASRSGCEHCSAKELKSFFFSGQGVVGRKYEGSPVAKEICSLYGCTFR